MAIIRLGGLSRRLGGRATHPSVARGFVGAINGPQTLLQSKASLLSAGQSIKIATTFNETNLSPEGSNIIQWGMSCYYDSQRKEIGFIGKRDGPNRFHWLVYDEALDSWSLNPRDPWSTSSASGHGYDHHTYDAATGRVYHVPYGTKTPKYWDGSTWTDFTAWTQNTTATGGLTYFPGVGLCYNDGFGLLRFNGSTWDTVVTGDGTSYHDFSEYNSTADVLIFGGGNSSGYFKCTAGLSVSSIAAPSFTIGTSPATMGTVCSDPASANLIARQNSTGNWAKYDIGGNAWSSLTKSTGGGSTPQTGTPNLQADSNNAAICCAIPAYGVTAWIQNYPGAAMEVWLYKHS